MVVLPPDIISESLLDYQMSHTAAQLEVFPTDLQMRRIDPVYNMRRFYRMSIQPDLFGGASLVREWGRIGARGQMMVENHPDEGEAITALIQLAAVKKRRGYTRFIYHAGQGKALLETFCLDKFANRLKL